MFGRIAKLALVLAVLSLPVNANVLSPFIQFPAGDPPAGDIDLSTFAYVTGKVCDLNTVLGFSSVTEGRWSDDGSKIYVLDSGTDTLETVDLSTNYDPSTCSDASESLDVSGTHTQPQGFDVDPTGKILTITGNSADDAERYNCTTAGLFTDANCTHDSADRINFSGIESNPRAFAWCDGNNAGVMGNQGDGFDHFEGTGDNYDGSTFTHTDFTSSGTNTPEGLDFVNAQQAIWASSNTNTIKEATFTADCDLSTFVVGDSINVNSQDTAMTSVDIGNSNTSILGCGNGTDSCYLYE